MLTGDQKTTAEAIALALDLGEGELRVADAAAVSELENTSDLSRIPHVFARVTPSQKLKIVEALQRSGLVVAMTGDGVNDSPALKASDIGVAMGDSGSEAAREVAHIVLEDDNLESLIPAIQQGRATHANIRRAIRYLLATNISEILLMVLGPAANLGQPLTPAQLLWITCLQCGSPLSDNEGNAVASPINSYWNEALNGQRLIDDETQHGVQSWAPPMELARLLLMRRDPGAGKSAGNSDPRLLGVVVPEIDAVVASSRIVLPSPAKPILPLMPRDALLAAVAILERQGPFMLARLEGKMIGQNRSRFRELAATVLGIPPEPTGLSLLQLI